MSVTPQAFYFQLQKLVADAGTEKYLIAYSGGVDSHVLLHLCSQLKNSPSGFDCSFSAVYIDHGLSGQSKKWGKHCQHICFQLDIPLIIVEVDASPKKGQSPEASARTARYQAFSQLLDKNECLLTAQHLDDQAETLLLQLLRGSGSKGLSAMPRIKPFAQGFLCRPILDYKKQDILQYARQHQLQWVEDDSNLEQCFDRNYLRHTVFPLLEKRWPAVKENFAKSADVLAESQSLLDKIADTAIQSLLFVNSEGIIEYDKLLLEPVIELLKASHPCHTALFSSFDNRHEQAHLNNLLRYWIGLNHLPMPSKKILQQMVSSVVLARADAMPLVSWSRDAFHCELRRYRDKLYLLDVSLQFHPINKIAQKDERELTLSLDQELILKHINSSIKIIAVTADNRKNGFSQQVLLSKKITVRFRKGGERLRKIMDGHSHPLKHWFQEQGIPPWERDQLPLVFWGDELIQIGNSIVNHSLSHSLNNGRSGEFLSIHWQRIKK